MAIALAQVVSPANHTCRFGKGGDDGPWYGAEAVVVLGSVGSGGTTIECLSPAVIRPVDPLYGRRPLYGDVLPSVPVEYSLNGQQYTAQDSMFTYAPHTTLSRVSPSSGPLAGGTMVRVRGAELWAHDTHRVCAFGEGAEVVRAQGW